MKIMALLIRDKVKPILDKLDQNERKILLRNRSKIWTLSYISIQII